MTKAGAPATYADWLPLLERFRDGDDSVLPALESGTIEWTNVVAERWTKIFSDVLRVRLEAISKRLQTALDRAAGDAFAVSKSLLSARRALAPLRALAALTCMPGDLRAHFGEEVARFAAQTQQSLESSAARTRGDYGVMLKAIRDNPLTAAETPPERPEPPPDSPPDSPLVQGRGRRVLG